MPTIKATTPEELRDKLVLWARNEAREYRKQSTLAERKGIKKALYQKGDVFAFIADYWEKMEIVSQK